MPEVSVAISQDIVLRDPNNPNLTWNVFRPLQGVQLGDIPLSGQVLVQLTGFDFKYDTASPSTMGIELIATIDGNNQGQSTIFQPFTPLRTFQVAITDMLGGSHNVGISARAALLGGPPEAVTVYGQATFSVDVKPVFFTFDPLSPTTLASGEVRVVKLNVSAVQNTDLQVALSVSGGDLQVVPVNPIIAAGGDSVLITLIGGTAGTNVVTASATDVTAGNLSVPVVPVLTELQPTSGPPGTAITLVGRGFSPGATAYFTLNSTNYGDKGLAYIDSSHLALSRGATFAWEPGPYSISVESGGLGLSSNQLTFNLTPLPQVKWTTFTGVARGIGVSPSGRVSVYKDERLGWEAGANALDMLEAADSVVAANDAIFGTTGGNVSVLVWALYDRTDGTGGALHNGCDYSVGNAIEVCAAYGDPRTVIALFEAELSECSMGGNLCGLSTGEALSRWCAMAISNHALLDAFLSAPTWYATPTDWVDDISETDQDTEAYGCGMAFLSWLISLGYKLSKIAPAMVLLGDRGTLAQLYAKLTGDKSTNAWTNFKAAVSKIVIVDDDPFKSLPKAMLVRAQQPLDYARAGEVISAVLADLTAGSPPRVIADHVFAVLDPSSRSASTEQSARICSVHPRVLRPPSI